LAKAGKYPSVEQNKRNTARIDYEVQTSEQDYYINIGTIYPEYEKYTDYPFYDDGYSKYKRTGHCHTERQETAQFKDYRTDK